MLRLFTRQLSTSGATMRNVRAGRYRVSIKQDKPLTYEEAHRPYDICLKKHWNSQNTSAFPGYGLRKSEAGTEDMFIRKFIHGTWHRIFVSEILIKRQHNSIRVAGIIQRSITARKMYFLIGYTEELLSHWLQCPVKLELQSVNDRKDVVFKYV